MIPPHPKQSFEIGRNSAFLLTLLVLLLSAFLGQGTVHADAEYPSTCAAGIKNYATRMENTNNVPIEFCIYKENNDIIFKISCSPGQCSNWHWPDGNGSETPGTRPWLFDGHNNYTNEIRNSVTHIIVGGVKHIGNDAFNGFSNLKSVEISDDVESIGQAVFANCTQLEILIIPPSVKNIGTDAFSGVKGPVYAPAASLPEKPGEVRSIIFPYFAFTLAPQAGRVTLQSGTETPEVLKKYNTTDVQYFLENSPVDLTVDPGSDFVKVSAVSDNTPLSLTRSGSVFSLTMPAESVTFSTSAVSLSVDPLTYNGEEQTAVTVKDGNTTLTAGTDYDVTFLQNGTGITPKNAGKYTAVITGKGSYIGTASVSFTVNKADITPAVTMSDYTYGGTVPAPGIAEGRNPGSGAVTYYYSTVNSTGNGIKWENITGTTLEAGTYYMYAVVAETDNYKEGTTPAASFNVTAADGAKDVAPITTAPQAADEWTEDGTEHALLKTAGASKGGTFYYKVNDGGWSSAVPTAAAAGEYKISYYIKGTGIYKDNGSETSPLGTLTVTVAEEGTPQMTVQPKGASGLVANGEMQDLLSVAGAADGGTVLYSVNGGAWSDAVPQASEAGEYKISYYIKGDSAHKDKGTPESPLGTLSVVIASEPMDLDVKFVFITGSGSRGVPFEVKDIKLNPSISIKDGDNIVSKSGSVTLEVKAGETEKSVTVTFSKKLSDLAPGKYSVTVSGLPESVDIEDYGGGPAKCKLSAKAEINELDGNTVIIVYLIFKDRSAPEEPAVYFLPEDEIGAYALRADGSKEYLLFHTLDICMAWLGREDLCDGPEHCFHKDGK